MKVIKAIQTILGYIPFIWFIFFVIILLIGTLKLGYVPKYGNVIDPYALNLELLSIIHVITATLSYLAVFVWILLTGILIILKRQIIINRTSFVFLLIGLVGFIIFKFFFTQIFLWVFD